MVFILSSLWWIRIRGLWRKLSDKRLTWGRAGGDKDRVWSDGRGYAQSLIQFSVDGWGCVSSLLFVPSLQMATHSSILAWKIPWMEKPGRLQSMGLQRVRHYWATSLSLSKDKITYPLDKDMCNFKALHLIKMEKCFKHIDSHLLGKI